MQSRCVKHNKSVFPATVRSLYIDRKACPNKIFFGQPSNTLSFTFTTNSFACNLFKDSARRKMYFLRLMPASECLFDGEQIY